LIWLKWGDVEMEVKPESTIATGWETTTNPTPEEKKTEVTILDVTKIPSSSPDRIGKFDVVIVYQTPDGKTYMVSVPEEEVLTEEGKYDEKKIAEIIRKELKKKAELIGKKIVV